MSEDILVQAWDRKRMPFGVNRSPWSLKELPASHEQSCR